MVPAILPLLADPNRWQLLAELSRSDRRVGELTELLGKPQNLVSYHLGELRSAGIVTGRRSSADRRDVYYRADLARCRDLLAAAGVGVHPGLRLTPAPPANARPTKARVLFLCTGNSARSQMAEAFLDRLSGGRIVARSAGSQPKPLHPHAVAVMAARGVDIAGRPTKHYSQFARSRFDRVITLCDKVREVCPEFPGAPAAHWSMPDPAADEATPAAFEAVATEIEERVGFLITDLAERRHHGR